MLFFPQLRPPNLFSKKLSFSLRKNLLLPLQVDPESLERENDRSIDALGERVGALRAMTSGIHGEVESQHRLLDSMVRLFFICFLIFRPSPKQINNHNTSLSLFLVFFPLSFRIITPSPTPWASPRWDSRRPQRASKGSSSPRRGGGRPSRPRVSPFCSSACSTSS